MRIAIVNILNQVVVEKVDADNAQAGIDNYLKALADEYDLSLEQFCFRNPLIVMNLRAWALH